MENSLKALSDINSRADIDHFVAVFYERLLEDDRISFIFTDIAKIDLPHHLPKIADFWESILLNAPVYDGNPMKVHLDLDNKSHLSAEMFEIWLGHLDATLDSLFAGAATEQAKMRAKSIAMVMQTKIWHKNKAVDK